MSQEDVKWGLKEHLLFQQLPLAKKLLGQETASKTEIPECASGKVQCVCQGDN